MTRPYLGDSQNIDHYDLLGHPVWKAKSVLIISPYVEREFFKNIFKLKPATLTVIIDDGCRSDDVTMIQNLAQRWPQVRVNVALGSAPGLVHAKIFYIEWRTPEGHCRHTFVFGSGNATRQAFDGNFNAESICKVRLTAAKHSAILDWTKDVLTAAAANPPSGKIAPVRNAELANGISIRLPSITIKDAVNKADNFDLWLQRGYLLSSYKPDSRFMRIQVPLRKKIPSGTTGKIFKNQGFKLHSK